MRVANSNQPEAALGSGGDGGGIRARLARAGYAMHHRNKSCARLRNGTLWPCWPRPQLGLVNSDWSDLH